MCLGNHDFLALKGGFFRPLLSDMRGLPGGVDICSLQGKNCWSSPRDPLALPMRKLRYCSRNVLNPATMAGSFGINDGTLARSRSSRKMFCFFPCILVKSEMLSEITPGEKKKI